MKLNFCIFLVVFLLVVCVNNSLACTCVNGDLSKRFKKAEAVFVGKLYDFDEEDIPKIQNFRKGLPVLLVNKSWKGVNRELVAIDFDFSNVGVSCPTLERFDDDADYLVFAYGKELKVKVVCSDTSKLTPHFDGVTREILKLNSSWFRFRAKINPF